MGNKTSKSPLTRETVEFLVKHTEFDESLIEVGSSCDSDLKNDHDNVRTGTADL